MVLRKENDARHKVGQLTYHFHTGIQSPPHGYTMDYQAFERRKREQVAQDPAAENLPSPHAPANATMDHKVTTASVLSVSSGSTTAEYPEAVPHEQIDPRTTVMLTNPEQHAQKPSTRKLPVGKHYLGIGNKEIPAWELEQGRIPLYKLRPTHGAANLHRGVQRQSARSPSETRSRRNPENVTLAGGGGESGGADVLAQWERSSKNILKTDGKSHLAIPTHLLPPPKASPYFITSNLRASIDHDGDKHRANTTGTTARQSASSEGLPVDGLAYLDIKNYGGRRPPVKLLTVSRSEGKGLFKVTKSSSSTGKVADVKCSFPL